MVNVLFLNLPPKARLIIRIFFMNVMMLSCVKATQLMEMKEVLIVLMPTAAMLLKKGGVKRK